MLYGLLLGERHGREARQMHGIVEDTATGEPGIVVRNWEDRSTRGFWQTLYGFSLESYNVTFCAT